MYCCQRGLPADRRALLLRTLTLGDLMDPICCGNKACLSTFHFSLREERKLRCNQTEFLF